MSITIITPTVSYRLWRIVSSELRAASCWLDQIIQRRTVAITLVGLLAFGGSATIALLVGIPEPRVHDEFSYLLAADTFMHGRLSNPTHPMWIYFESFHIIQQPTYASKYPPAQGLILAAGQVIAGHPIVGVWGSVGFMCAAICWMLYAWTSARWAVLGGVLAAVNYGVDSYWGQSYWGGAVAATGGALVFGALRRIMQQPTSQDTILLGMGLVLLANSRPYEGFLVSLPAAVALLGWMISQHGPPLQVSLRRIILPLLVMLVTAGTAMGYYNLRVTGHVFRLPYQVYEETYALAPLFLWQVSRPEPIYHHEIIREFHQKYLRISKGSLKELINLKREAFGELWGFFLGYGLTLPLMVMLPVMVPVVLRDRWLLFAFLTCSVLIVGLLTQIYTFPHYAAPLTSFPILFVLRALQLWRERDRVIGQYITWLVLFLCIASLVWTAKLQMKRDTSSAWYAQRARLLQQLKEQGGQHLILVRYGPQHSFHYEWVYNEADIDRAQVVWARDMGMLQNRQLVEYFQDRRVWLLQIDDDRSVPQFLEFTKGVAP